MTENGMKRAYIEDSYFTSVLFIRVGLFYLFAIRNSVCGRYHYYFRKGMSRNTNRPWRNSNGKRNANSILQNRFLYECGA